MNIFSYFCGQITNFSMRHHTQWHDDYWLMLLQLYLKNPVGLKPLYSRPMVDLAMELHIPPQALRRRMEQIDRLDTPRIERIWRTYSKNPTRLSRAVRLLRSMKGFGLAEEFYEGVELQETFEKDFRPIPEAPQLTPMKLTVLLSLYFQLTPATMVAETPEVQQTARMMKIDTALAVQVLDAFMHCDPYLNRHDFILSPLLLPCQQVWQRYGNTEPQQLAALVEELKEYFK